SNTGATTLSGTAGSLTFVNAGNLTLGVTTVTNTMTASSTTNINTIGAVQANNLTLQSGVNGNITLGANTTGTTSITYTAGAGGVISQLGGVTAGNTLTINS